jgi:hypothetical protein
MLTPKGPAFWVETTAAIDAEVEEPTSIEDIHFEPSDA